MPRLVQPAQKQITYNGVEVAVTPTPDGGAILGIITATEVVMLPLSPEARAEIGRKLLAPSVAVAPANGAGH